VDALSARDDDSKTNRQIARSKQKRAGDRSAQVANALMKLSDAALKKLEVDDELRESIVRARAVIPHIARRRAERTLAGELRRIEIGEVEAALAKVAEHGAGDVRQFHLAEQWRAKLIEEGMAAAASFPVATDDELPRLVDAARRERETGRPPGAARALFRHIAGLLKAAEIDAAPDNSDSADPSDE
jgi:ribosome-associated protein